MTGNEGHFAWYELMTGDVAAAKTFYGNVVGWECRDASTRDLSYHLFVAGSAPVGGVMELPGEARKKGATSRWMGYVAVGDVDAVARRIKRLGGAIYVPPTTTNIGRIAVVADPQTATLALVGDLKPVQPQPATLTKVGHVGWHELLADDWSEALAFYGALFDWQKADAEIGPTETYQSFSAGGQIIGGMFTKRAMEPVPFWLFYFNVEDIDAALGRVKLGGGQIFEGPVELPDGEWIARCRDHEGTAFALQGQRTAKAASKAGPSEVGWSTEWGGFSSKGRLRVTRPRS